MQKPEIPQSEPERLDALRRYEILDTPPEQAFDDLTKLASHIAGTPIALVSLIDSDRQWFKSKVGLDADETPRDLAFCAHAINQDGLFVVEDATRDPRFHDNPLVTGDPRVIFYAGAPLLEPSGEALGTLCVIDHSPRELTGEQREMISALSRQVMTQMELRRHMRHLVDTNVQTMEASRAKTEFLANMSHELRTPLNSIIGYSEILAMMAEKQSQPVFVEKLQRIHSAGQHLLGLINDILDLSKIEAGRMELHLETFEIEPQLRDVLATSEPLAAKNGNTLRPELDEGLGQMLSDVTRVRQILFNLISNACKFTDRGTVTLSARRIQENGNEFIVLEVSDTGIGMTAEQLTRIFEQFAQAESSTTRRFGGTGLGLAICRRFSEMLGGTITVRSEPARGSTFTVRLPASGKAVEPKASERSATERPMARPTGNNRVREGHVLVIDDDPAARDLISSLLRAEGIEVVTADSGQRGLEMAREMQPIAITLDVMMPHMDGWAVLQTLKADPALCDIPVIMVTMTDDRDVGLALGASEFINKPMRREDLRRALERLAAACHQGTALVVDDDETTRLLFRDTLTEQGWTVVEASDGETGLSALDERSVDLVVLDLMMPGIDGFEFAHRMRERDEWREIPVIVCTARDLQHHERERLSRHVVSVIHKGAHSREGFLREVQRVVSSQSAESS